MPGSAADGAGSAAAVAGELERMTGELTATQKETFRDVLEDAVGKDAYACWPSPREVFFGAPREGARVIAGTMPHYGFFFGPMQYLVRRDARAWRVEVVIAVEAPRGARTLELPDCALRPALDGPLECSGTPFSASQSVDACPGSGVFTAPATAANVRALLARWSVEAERYYERDAERYRLPISYDFEFVLAAESEAKAARVDLRVPLATTCGRTPYFSAFRSGWSLPVVAHEVGHVLGLLDEYETFSGVVAAYPKTPFPGAEVSRMGLSMREGTRVLPLHHYLVLRRYFCDEPDGRDPYAHALP